MKKKISILICAMLFVFVSSFTALAQTTVSETTAESSTVTETQAQTKKVETTEFVLEIDVNKRYTNFANEAEDEFNEEKEEQNTKKTVYIAILSAALVVSVVILAVSLKRVPKEEDIDISGQNKIKKDKEEKPL